MVGFWLQDAGIDNVFFWINPREKCTQTFTQCYVKGKVTSWSLLVTPLAAPSIIKQVLQSIYGCFRKRRVHTRLHIYPLCGIFCFPWHRHSDTRNLSFMSHSKDEASEVHVNRDLPKVRSDTGWSKTSVCLSLSWIMVNINDHPPVFIQILRSRARIYKYINSLTLQ
jgi:hypothetical protein